MNSVPLSIARVSSQLSGALFLGTITGNQIDLLKLQQQLSTGQRLNLPSDDPGATLGIQSLKRQIANNDQFNSNLDFAGNFLKVADSTLGSVSDLLRQASSIAESDGDSVVSSDQRAADAQIINNTLTSIFNLSNKQYGNQYIFAGQSGATPAFTSAGGGYKYTGSTQPQAIITATGGTLDYTVNGDTVFGGLSSQVVGYQNLTPALTTGTQLSDLAGANGKGIAKGLVNVTVGATTVQADLSSAATINDVLNAINGALTTAGSTATIVISGSSLAVNGDATQSATIADVGTGTTASDLGIAITVPATVTATGGNLAPKITDTTPLGALNGGAGVDPTGFTITNGNSTATISLSGLTTVQDLINAVNSSGTNVHAEINAAGNGINLFNPISGSPLRIGENGGTTANDLGIRSFNTNTQLADLNSNTGITPISQSVQGLTGQIKITRTDGSTFNVTVTGVTTTSGLVAAINSAGNPAVSAAVNANGNGITLTDTTGGGGNVAISKGPNYSDNSTLGNLFGTGTGGTLTTPDLTFPQDDFKVTRRDGTTFTVNVTGATTIQDILNRINNADGNTNPANKVTASLNTVGNGIALSDASTGSTNFAVTGVNASPVAQQLGILKTAGGATPGTINGDDVNPLQPTGVFSTLALLRDSLLINDTAGIARAAKLLGADMARVTKSQAIVGAREQDIGNRQSDISDEQTQLKSSLSLLSDTDFTEAATKFQTLQTAYQAALKVASTTQNLSLLDFLQ